jgi:sRNA-binding protein
VRRRDFTSHFRYLYAMARRTILVCDNCGKEVDEQHGAVMRITYSDARRGAKQADLCGDCAGNMPGQPAARRGRRPKSASTPA